MYQQTKLEPGMDFIPKPHAERHPTRPEFERPNGWTDQMITRFGLIPQ